jgi:uncharacterized protein YbcV (DUF1398 family)
MNTKAIAECMRLSFGDTPFPVVVEKLAGAGVTSYAADLIALRKTYYSAGAESADEPMPPADGPAIAGTFDAAAVETSVRAIQQKKIGYAEFLRQIMCAGCARYSVFIVGRKAMYFGRNGEFYTEPFPGGAN